MLKDTLSIKVFKNSKLSLALFLVIFAGIGVYLLTDSHAATPYVSINAAQGSIANGAASQACTGASDGNCVTFGSITGGGVNSEPKGPATPSGGWSVAYADGFTDPMGTGSGQDNTWFSNRYNGNSNPCVNAPPDNANETDLYNCSQAKVDSGGLELTCTYSPGVGSGKSDLCGRVQGNSGNTPGYKAFGWTPAKGETWAFEVDAKFPKNTGEEDVGWWSSDPCWGDEFDFFESWGWGNPPTSGYTQTNTGIAWIYNTGNTSCTNDSGSYQNDEGYKQFWPSASQDPSLAFHRYTTVVYPNNTWSFYIDGVLQTGGTGLDSSGTPGVMGPAGQAAAIIKPVMNLILQYSLRTPSQPIGFNSGSRTFTVRSAAVYQDAGHAGKDIVNGGLAPGTTLNP
jgi:hypothetical protein